MYMNRSWGGKAAAAAEYPADLCRAMCRGLVRQQRYEQEQSAASARQGRGELKSLILKVTKGMGIRSKRVNRMTEERRNAQDQCKNTGVAQVDRLDADADSIVRNDLRRPEERTERRRESRKVRDMIGTAK